MQGNRDRESFLHQHMANNDFMNDTTTDDSMILNKYEREFTINE